MHHTFILLCRIRGRGTEEEVATAVLGVIALSKYFILGSGWSACLACTEPRAGASALHKLGLMTQIQNPSSRTVEQDGQVFIVILSYIVSLRLAWATHEPVSKPTAAKYTHQRCNGQDRGRAVTILLLDLCVHLPAVPLASRFPILSSDPLSPRGSEENWA